PGRVDDERQLAHAPDPVHPPGAVAAVVDAGRTEAGPDGQRGHGVAGLVPCRADGRGTGGQVAGRVPAVVTLPDPAVVHDRLVVVAHQARKLGPDRGQVAFFGRLHGAR